MILLSAVSLFYLMSFYIIKKQKEKTLQKIKKNPRQEKFWSEEEAMEQEREEQTESMENKNDDHDHRKEL